jgi:hypothetical protein
MPKIIKGQTDREWVKVKEGVYVKQKQGCVDGV